MGFGAYKADNFTGGGTDTVDSYSDMNTGDQCFCTNSGSLYYYIYDSTSSESTSVPDVIRPVSDIGAWILQTINFPGYIGKNVLINGNPNINQDSVSGTVTLVADEYGHDMWKGGDSGCTYTFSTTENVTIINITSGTLVQEVYGDFFRSGTHVLTWSGTAQAQIDSGGYDDSGLTATLTGGTNSTVEFGIGTFSLAQLERGTSGTSFCERVNELELCRLFYRRVDYASDTYVGTGNISDSIATIGRGTHSAFGDLSGMIGSPVIERSTGWRFLYGQTEYVFTTLNIGETWFTGTFSTVGNQYQVIILIALADSYISASTRL